jgi:ABC-type sugar transport system substrate-binding protein
MQRVLTSLAASLALLASAAQADNVKIGVVQALSGPPVVVDFSESYLQGIEAALDDYKARRRAIQSTRSRSPCTTTRPTRSARCRSRSG